MNKRIFFFFAVFFTVLNIQAQVTAKPGLRAGFSFSTISEMHADYKTDFYAVVLLILRLQKFTRYSQKLIIADKVLIMLREIIMTKLVKPIR